MSEKDTPAQRSSQAVPEQSHPTAGTEPPGAPGSLDAASVQVPPPEEALSLLKRLESLRGSRVLAFVTRPDVTVRGDVLEPVYEQLRAVGKTERLDLFLHSSGGQTEVPWRLVTLLRDFCDHLGALIPAKALSAATHVAMGADEIVMGPFSELSPVDPARSHPLLPSRAEGELPLTISVQDLRHFVEFVKTEMGDCSSDALAQVWAALFEKIHPLAIGAIQQSYALSRLISRKVLSTHMDPERDGERMDKIVDALSDEFFSHHYLIGWREAREIGLHVTYADDDLWETMWALYKHYKSFFDVFRELGAADNIARAMVWIDTVHCRRVLEEVLAMKQGSTGRIDAARITSQWLAVDWGDQDFQAEG